MASIVKSNKKSGNCMHNIMKVMCLILFSANCIAGQSSPYVGEETREIKAMSQDDVDGYLSGKGMGLAKAAELNGYPGPKHVLDLSKELNLSKDQINKSNILFSSMQSETKSLGALLIQKEKELDFLFASASVDHSKLENILASIGKIKSDIRLAHLKTHIEQKEMLSQHQLALYAEHRGYSSTTNHSGHSAHH